MMERIINPKQPNKAMHKFGILLMIFATIMVAISAFKTPKKVKLHSIIPFGHSISEVKAVDSILPTEDTILEERKQHLRALRMHNVTRNMSLVQPKHTEQTVNRRQNNHIHQNTPLAYW